MIRFSLIFLLILHFLNEGLSQSHFVKMMGTNENRHTYASVVESDDDVVMVGTNDDSYGGEVVKLNRYGMVDPKLNCSHC